MQIWLSIVEPLLRRWPGYPRDWQWRRMFVFERASGRCESCGLPAGSIRLRDTQWRVTAAHVHHLLPIAAGGGHALRNLQLLCAACHRGAHPENTGFGGRSAS